MAPCATCLPGRAAQCVISSTCTSAPRAMPASRRTPSVSTIACCTGCFMSRGSRTAALHRSAASVSSSSWIGMSARSSGSGRPAQEAPHPVPMRHRPRLAVGRSDTRSQDRPRRRRRLPLAELRSGAAVPRLRIDCFLAGLLIAVGLALLLGAAGHSWAVAATFAALSLTDVLLTAAGLLVAAMTGVAGALVVADARADVAAAQAWQDLDAELVMVGTPAEATPGMVSTRATPASLKTKACGGSCSRTGSSCRFRRSAMPVQLHHLRADAVAAGEIDGVQSGTELLIADQHPAADRHRARMAETSDAALDCPPLPIAGNVKEIGRRGQRSTKRRVSRALLVANAGVWWQ